LNLYVNIDKEIFLALKGADQADRFEQPQPVIEAP
jgi:hypothetical protein